MQYPIEARIRYTIEDRIRYTIEDRVRYPIEDRIWYTLYVGPLGPIFSAPIFGEVCLDTF